MSNITKGMQVQLISGGPIMAVSDVGDYSGSGGPAEGAKCTWFDAKKTKQEEVFDVAVLKPCTSAVGSVGIRRA